MKTYFVPMNLNEFRDRLSRSLGCRCSLADVRSLLENAGFEETWLGWFTHDMRPLMIALYPQRLGHA